MTDQANDPLKTRLLDAILPHVVFDGWGPESFAMACADIDVPETAAAAAFPRGAVELAVEYHRRGDAQMIAALEALPMESMRIREKVASAVMARLTAVGDKELVRRGTALFALPQYAGDGAALIWGTADAIWNAIGDTSDDGNWYSKRTVLSAVYTATVLFWLGDHSEGDADTKAFLDRRIENVMQFEKLKAQAGKLPVFGKLFESAMSGIKAPGAATRDDLPGTTHNRN